MSFIYAEKYLKFDSDRESLRVLCDTKATPNDYSATNFSSSAYDLIMKYGVVKSTICCPELCISFAGNNIVFASKLFMKLKDMGQFEVEDAPELALEIHNTAPSRNDIEFIISYISDDQLFIDCVKDGKLERNLQIAHIGSDDAFREFQRIRLSNPRSASEQTRTAFQNVVDSGCDDTVGGFAFEVVFDHEANSFVYNWERAFHTSKPQLFKAGENINFYMSALDGGYSYEIVHQDIENVKLIIDQMTPAILFSRRFRVNDCDVRNPNLFGLMMPMLVEIKDDGNIVRCK